MLIICNINIDIYSTFVDEASEDVEVADFYNPELDLDIAPEQTDIPEEAGKNLEFTKGGNYIFIRTSKLSPISFSLCKVLL